MKTDQAMAEVFFTAFKALRSNERLAFIEKVISDPSLRKDFLDLAFIEEARQVKGKALSAQDYFETRRRKD